MTNLYDGSIVQGLPAIVGNQAYTKALAVAISNMFRMVLDYADKARTYSGVDVIQDHKVMDALAIELRASPYSVDMDIETKRELVKFALQYWSKAGTKSATEEVVRRIFGEAEISEWFEYDGTPGCFRIGISDSAITGDAVSRFMKAAENVKRLSAWLDKVQLIIKLEPWTQYCGFCLIDAETDTMKMRRDGNLFVGFAVQEGTTHTLRMNE